MNIYPAIDLYEGQVVRLMRGDYGQKTVYGKHPEEIARRFEEEGARWLHVVDLEGAKTGRVANREALVKIRKAVGCRIEFGGGLRSVENIASVIADGIDRVIVGTKAMDEQFLRAVLEKFGDQVAVGLDIRDGKVQMEGWLKDGGANLETAIDFLNRTTVSTLIYTNIQKDGMLGGPDMEGLKKVLNQSRARVILSGGIGALKDVAEAAGLRHERLEGVIIGKALYEKKFSVRQAVDVVRQTGKEQP